MTHSVFVCVCVSICAYLQSQEGAAACQRIAAGLPKPRSPKCPRPMSRYDSQPSPSTATDEASLLTIVRGEKNRVKTNKQKSEKSIDMFNCICSHEAFCPNFCSPLVQSAESYYQAIAPSDCGSVPTPPADMRKEKPTFSLNTRYKLYIQTSHLY